MAVENVQGIEFDPSTWPTQPGPKTLEIIKDLMEKAHSEGLDEGFALCQEETEWQYVVKTYPANGDSNFTDMPTEEMGRAFAEVWNDEGKRLGDPKYKARLLRRRAPWDWEEI